MRCTDYVNKKKAQRDNATKLRADRARIAAAGGGSAAAADATPMGGPIKPTIRYARFSMDRVVVVH